jgi:hypothetical protein
VTTNAARATVRLDQLIEAHLDKLYVAVDDLVINGPLSEDQVKSRLANYGLVRGYQYHVNTAIRPEGDTTA